MERHEYFSIINKKNTMNFKFLLGLAAGIGVAYFFTSKKGQDFLEELGNSASDLMDKGEDVWQNGKDKADKFSNLTENFVKNQF